MKKGFYFYTPKMEYFFVTKSERRTESLCKRVYEALRDNGCKYVFNNMYHGMFGDFSIHDKLQYATCEVKHTERYGDYYDIKGIDFSCTSFLRDEKMTVIELD